jgi:phage gp29-like protein
VSTGFDILKYLLSSKEWILTSDEETSDEVHEFINNMLKNLQTELNTIVKQMTSAILWGFSVHEIMYDVVDGQLIVNDLVPLHIKTLQHEPFVYNDDGDLTDIHQVSQNGEVDIPINKCLLYSYNSLYDEKEGHGLLYDFLPIVDDKEHVMDWLMTYAEKNEAPTLYGKTSNPASRDEMLKSFEDISDGTVGITIGMEDEVGVLESTHRGETFFDILQYKDNQIFRRMFIGNLLLGDNSQTGTYAQSQTQLEFGNMVFDGILEEIANNIQMQIINPIVEFNYGPETKAPIVSFDKFSKGDMEKLFSIIKPLMDTGVVDSENSAVQESIALLFKAEAGVEYTNSNDPILENFGYQPTPVDGANLTNNILSDLDGITK